MAQFFINRPIFAWVIALFIIVMGSVAVTQLPVSQYPPVAPPSIVISVGYPGASAQTLEDSVLSVIEREMNGSPGMIYMESVAQANGTGTITISFETGTNPDLAQVDVQNRLSRAAPRWSVRNAVSMAAAAILRTLRAASTAPASPISARAKNRNSLRASVIASTVSPRAAVRASSPMVTT